MLPKIKREFKRIFGPRTVKTAVATVISMIICDLLNLNAVVLAGIAAIVTMSSSVFESLENSVNRIISTVTGALIALLFHYLNFVNYISLMIGIIIIVYILNKFNWKKTTSLSMIVYLIIMTYSPSEPEVMTVLQYSINRVFTTVIGVLVGFTINYFFMPPSRVSYLLDSYKLILSKLSTSLFNILTGRQVTNLQEIYEILDNINIELKNIRDDKKIHRSEHLRMSELMRINSELASTSGLVSQFSEHIIIPEITEANRTALEEYFKIEILIDETETSEEFVTAFNYYLDELICHLRNLDEEINDLQKTLDRQI